MDRLAKRYLISGIIAITSMLLALAFVLIKAGSKVSRADAPIQPALSIDQLGSAAPPAPAGPEPPRP